MPHRLSVKGVQGATRKDHAIASAYRMYKHSLREIADFLGAYSTVSRRLKKHESDDRS
jgi:IS30 family transposase